MDSFEMDDIYNNEAMEAISVLELYEESLSQIEPLTAKEREELIAKMFDGDEKAKERLIEGHLYLVMEVLEDYLDQGILALDLIQEGNLGIMQGVHTYTEGDFITHLNRTLVEAFEDVVAEQLNLDENDKHIAYMVNATNEAITTLATKLDREPTLLEIGDYLGISEDEVRAYMKQALDVLE